MTFLKTFFVQIERERDEHLMPRLVNRSPSPEPIPEPEPIQRQPSLKQLVDPTGGSSSQSSPESDGAEPLRHESRSPSYSQDSSSQQYFGAPPREEGPMMQQGMIDDIISG